MNNGRTRWWETKGQLEISFPSIAVDISYSIQVLTKCTHVTYRDVRICSIYSTEEYVRSTYIIHASHIPLSMCPRIYESLHYCIGFRKCEGWIVREAWSVSRLVSVSNKCVLYLYYMSVKWNTHPKLLRRLVAYRRIFLRA